MAPKRTKRQRLPSRRSATILVAAGLAVAMTACGSDDEPSAQEQYCEAGDSLETSVDSLTNLDLLAEGTDGLESAVNDVKGDVSELGEAATDASADEVSALEQSVDDLGSALSDLGGEITSENVGVVSTAVQGVVTAAQSVYGTLTDCG